MLLNESLIKFGLSKKGASIYLATLELGKATAQEIAEKAELPRSTSYSVIESLISKQLLFPVQERKIKEYTAEDPKKIFNLSSEATRLIKEALPELNNLYRQSKARPKIIYHEGLSAIKEVYDDILRMPGLKEYLIIGPEKIWIGMDEKWFSDFKIRRASAKIKTRMIIEDSDIARQRQKDGMKYLSEVKIVSINHPYQFTGGAYIFRDKVIFLEYKKDLISVEVYSKGMADLQRLMFESLWKSLPEYQN